jgi:GAF domain-containing protein/two-component sensor histidine kinase
MSSPQVRFLSAGRDLIGIRKDGSEFPIEIGLNPVEMDGKQAVIASIIDISERKRAEVALRERVRLAEFSADIGSALTEKQVLRPMLQKCAETMVRHLNAAFARIWTLNSAENMLELQASAGMYTHIDGGHGRVRVGQFKIGLIAEERKPHLTNSVIGDPRVNDQNWAKREGMIAFAGYPLLVENRLIGVMAMFARQRLSDVMLQAMASVANEMAVGIERKLAEERAQRNYERIRALHEIDKAISSTLKLTEVLDILLKSVELSCPFAAAMGVRLFEKTTRRMVPVAARNILLEEWAGDLAQTSGALVKTLVETKAPVVIPNLARDPRTGQHAFAAKHGLVSYLGIPLIVKDEVIGTLVIYTKEERAFTGEEIEFCMTLGGQAAMAIQNATLYLQTERHLKRIEALHEIDNAITSTLELGAVLELLLEKIVVFLPVPAATNIRLFNPATGKFENTACQGMDESMWKAEGRESGQLSRRIRETKRPFFIENIQMDSEKMAPSFLRKQGFVSYLGVPLIAKNEVVGILGFYTRKFHQFDQQEVDFLLTLAGQAAVAIHNAQLYEQINVSKSSLESTNQSLQKSLRQLSGLYTALAPLTPSESIHQMMGGIIERLLEATGSDAGLIRVRDPQTGTYPFSGHRGFPDDYLRRVETAPAGGAVDWVVKHGEPIIAPDIAQEPRFKGKVQLQLGFRSCAMLPLKVQNEVRGIFHLTSRQAGYFDEGQRDHLMAIARQMTIALENKELFESLRRSRDELEKANKVKGEFLSIVSHELRTPLNIIMGYAGVMKDGMVGEINKEQEETLRKVLGSAGDLFNMINNIMHATRIEARVVALECHPLDLGEFIDRLRTDYTTRGEKKDVGLIWDYSAGSTQIVTDGDKLKQILRNLVDNALKFTDQGTVTVSVRVLPGAPEPPGSDLANREVAASNETAPWVECKVRDTGIGIAKEMHSAIFNKFDQVDTSATRPYEGLGLGLYIVKNFTDWLGGKIEIESEPGKGSTFTLTIPFTLKIT